MAKFKFNLEVVLKHRQMIEDDRQRELAAQLRKRMILMDQLRQMQSTIRDSKQRLGDGLVGQVDLSRISQFSHYNGQVTIRAQQIVHTLAVVERDVEVARTRLLQASQQRKALELLRDKRLALWKRQQDRREAIELDEIAVQRYARDIAMG